MLDRFTVQQIPLPLRALQARDGREPAERQALRLECRQRGSAAVRLAHRDPPRPRHLELRFATRVLPARGAIEALRACTGIRAEGDRARTALEEPLDHDLVEHPSDPATLGRPVDEQRPDALAAEIGDGESEQASAGGRNPAAPVVLEERAIVLRLNARVVSQTVFDDRHPHLVHRRDVDSVTLRIVRSMDAYCRQATKERGRTCVSAPTQSLSR
jgi:hypothetical protein